MRLMMVQAGRIGCLPTGLALTSHMKISGHTILSWDGSFCRINKRVESGCGESHTDGCGQGRESGHSYGETIPGIGFIFCQPRVGM